MALITGAAFGTTITQEDLYIEGAPNIYIQKRLAGSATLYNPDTDGFYWQLTGTTANPVYALGCYENVRLADNLTITDVRCDTVGSKAAIQKRNYLELSFSLKSLFPLSTMSSILKGSAVTTNNTQHTEKMGLGIVDNNTFFRVYMPKVYDENTGDWLAFTLHKVQFVEAWELQMVYGGPWMLGIRARAYADDTLPSPQVFATIIRADPSVL